MVKMRITEFWVQSGDRGTWRMKVRPREPVMLKKKRLSII
jgi:hypothetical protein